MTQYYRIQPEQDDYMAFELDTFDFLNKLGEEFELSDFGQPMLDKWQTIDGKFLGRVGGVQTPPDVTTWQTDLLLLSQKGYDALKDTLGTYGEFLPVSVDSETYYLLNILHRLPEEVIDMDNSEYEIYDEEEVGFKTLSFNAGKIPDDSLLFCIQNKFAYNIYCDDRFKNLIEEKGLGGLVFNTTLIDPYFK